MHACMRMAAAHAHTCTALHASGTHNVGVPHPDHHSRLLLQLLQHTLRQQKVLIAACVCIGKGRMAGAAI